MTEIDPAKIDPSKLNEENDFKRAQLLLKLQALEREKKDFYIKGLTNPLFVGVVLAFVGILGNAFVENKKRESQLLIEAIKTGNRNDTLKNLRFLKDLGLVSVSEKTLAQFESNQGLIPVLPGPGSTPLSVDLPTLNFQPWDCKPYKISKGQVALGKVLGFDISRFNNITSWSSLSEYYFVVAKATQGATSRDNAMTKNLIAAGQAGLVRGAYHVFTPVDALKQAQNFLETVGGLELGKCDLPPILDISSYSTSEKLNASEVLTWLRNVELQFGQKPIIYASPSATDLPNELGEYPLWVADYSSRPSPRIPKPWTMFTIHQYSDKGKITGISNDVDLNRLNGTNEKLVELTKRTPRRAGEAK